MNASSLLTDYSVEQSLVSLLDSESPDDVAAGDVGVQSNVINDVDGVDGVDVHRSDLDHEDLHSDPDPADPIEELLSAITTASGECTDATPSAPSSASAAALAATETERLPLSTRVRRRQELAYLRDQVQELESTVALLQAARRPASDEDTEQQQPSVWQGIASRQQHAKRKAEVENAQLRELVEAQLRLLQSLERLLHKRPTLLVRAHKHTGTLHRSSSLIFSCPSAVT
ncbi:hypothetical protein PINS_up012563 [Pythium insidiosum]|nr:hypothetical protein PINS_up012563 [Pythium insidiosum]